MKSIAFELALFVILIMISGCSSELEPTGILVASPPPTTEHSIPSPTAETDIDSQSSSGNQPSEQAPAVTATATSMPTNTQSGPESVSPTQPIPDSAPTTTPIGVPENSGSPAPTQQNCVDQVVFIKDVTVPDGTLFDPNESFTKTWRVKNSGTCTWDEGYALVFAGGDIMNGNLTNPIPSVDPGGTADISIILSAPTRFGEKAGNWLFQNGLGVQFGVGMPGTGKLWVLINVVSGGTVPSSTATDDQATTSQEEGSCAIQGNSAYESEIFGLLNQARAANGLGAVTRQSQLSAAALTHSKDMACNDFVDHSGSDASTWYDRVAKQGYPNYASARENIYVGDPAFGGDAQSAFNWWINSQVHRDNILNTNISEIGIGYAYLPGSTYGGYFTLVLARP